MKLERDNHVHTVDIVDIFKSTEHVKRIVFKNIDINELSKAIIANNKRYEVRENGILRVDSEKEEINIGFLPDIILDTATVIPFNYRCSVYANNIHIDTVISSDINIIGQLDIVEMKNLTIKNILHPALIFHMCRIGEVNISGINIENDNTVYDNEYYQYISAMKRQGVALAVRKKGYIDRLIANEVKMENKTAARLLDLVDISEIETDNEYIREAFERQKEVEVI